MRKKISCLNQHLEKFNFIKIPIILGIISCSLIILCSFFLIRYLSNSQQLWVRNMTEKTVIIKDCSINDKSVDNCFNELKKNYSIFFESSNILYHPQPNHFTVNVIIDKNEYQYACDFHRKKTDCIEEINIKNTELLCEKYCSSVYD